MNSLVFTASAVVTQINFYISVGLVEYIKHKKIILQFCKRHCN
jgi:hypothetical protein